MSREGEGTVLEGRDVLDVCRLDWDSYFMQLANDVAMRATCSRKRVGAVFVSDDHAILATGFNGAPRGMPHCDHSVTVISSAGTQHKQVDKNGNCITAVHAEMNGIFNAARHGVSLVGATVYLTVAPCRHCFHGLVQVGVRRIVYCDTCPYYDFTTKCERLGIVGTRLTEQRWEPV